MRVGALQAQGPLGGGGTKERDGRGRFVMLGMPGNSPCLIKPGRMALVQSPPTSGSDVPGGAPGHHKAISNQVEVANGPGLVLDMLVVLSRSGLSEPVFPPSTYCPGGVCSGGCNPITSQPQTGWPVPVLAPFPPTQTRWSPLALGQPCAAPRVLLVPSQASLSLWWATPRSPLLAVSPGQCLRFLCRLPAPPDCLGRQQALPLEC